MRCESGICEYRIPYQLAANLQGETPCPRHGPLRARGPSGGGFSHGGGRVDGAPKIWGGMLRKGLHSQAPFLQGEEAPLCLLFMSPHYGTWWKALVERYTRVAIDRAPSVL